MVTTQPDPGTTGSVTPDEGGTTFSKWRQLGSGVIRDGKFHAAILNQTTNFVSL